MKRILSVMLAIVMVFTMVPSTVLASNEGVNHGQKSTIVVNSDGKNKASMCNALFSEHVDIDVNDDMATMKIYVAYPVPAFASMGKDGTVKDFVITYNGREYRGISDIESKPEMTVRETNILFGLIKDKKISSQIVTFKLPKEALKAKYLDAKALVNVVMNKVVDFDLVIKYVEKPSTQKYFLEDGMHYVNFDLWHETLDEVSMGDKAFEKYPKALVAVKDGKIGKVQFATNPLDMMGIRSAVSKMTVDGKEVTTLETGKYLDDNKKQQEYLKRGEFELPVNVNLEKADDITYVNVSLIVPGIAMGDNLIKARVKFLWNTATKTTDEDITVEKDEITPNIKPTIVRPKAPKTVVSKLSKANGGYNDIVTTWSKVKNATGYFVYFKKSAVSNKWTYLGKTTNTTYMKKNLKNGTKYMFKVVSYVTVGGNNYKSEEYKIGTATTLSKLNMPTIKRVNKNKIKISWKNILGETGYQISKAKKANGTYIVKTIKTTNGKNVIIKAKRNNGYYYKVRAYKVVDSKKVFGPWSKVTFFGK